MGCQHMLPGNVFTSYGLFENISWDFQILGVFFIGSCNAVAGWLDGAD